MKFEVSKSSVTVLNFAFDVLFSVAATPLGQSKCSWGPSYWCQSYKQAVECKALEHCRSKVWAVKDDVIIILLMAVQIML